MSTKTISIHSRAYERLRAARTSPNESFSQVILRANWPEQTITAGELLEYLQQRGSSLSTEQLDNIENLKRSDDVPEDKWRKR